MKSTLIIVLSSALFAIVRTAPQFHERDARILAQDFVIFPDGYFSYNYETENQISANANGKLKVLQTNPYEDAEVIQGKFSWISPEGRKVEVQYIADETGYRPQIRVF